MIMCIGIASAVLNLFSLTKMYHEQQQQTNKQVNKQTKKIIKENKNKNKTKMPNLQGESVNTALLKINKGVANYTVIAQGALR